MRRHVHFHVLDSMAFYMLMTSIRTCAGLIFIDGNHEYEFALFDLQAAARHLVPGGFVLLDNVSQPGPFFAAMDFMRANSDWRECGNSLSRYRSSHPFDRNRTAIHNTDLLVLRAPPHITIAARPRTVGQQLFASRTVSGMRLVLRERATSGTLTAQCVLRGFGRTLVEVVGETNLARGWLGTGRPRCCSPNRRRSSEPPLRTVGRRSNDSALAGPILEDLSAVSWSAALRDSGSGGPTRAGRNN